MLKFLLKEIKDDYVRENFQLLRNFFLRRPFLRDWEFFEITFAGAVTNAKIKHTLNAKPQDIIQTSKIGLGNVTFEYEAFDAQYIVITTTGACKVRFFAGNHVEE